MNNQTNKSDLIKGEPLRDFEFTGQDFELVRKLIYQRAGISLGPGKVEMVYNRLAPRVRKTGHKNFHDYLAMLERSECGEWEYFTNSLTTNLTSFFREAHHFSTLVELLNENKNGRGLTIWSSACSTGEEPYSLAMTVADAFGSLTPPVRIIATDLDTTVLKTAQTGIYTVDKLNKVDDEKIRKYFIQGKDVPAGSARVRDELRNLVTFRQINLLDNVWPIRGPLDAIFCRNVMIYFDKATQRRVLEKFVPLLKPEGLLFAGHSENFFFAADLFRLRGRTVYELTNPLSNLAASR